MMQKFNRFLVILAIALFVTITIGYAALSASLTINGSSSIHNATWNIHFENIQVTTGSVTGDSVVHVASLDSERTTVSYELVLSVPGEFYEFTVDTKNDGTVDGMIESIDSKVNNESISNLPNYLDYSIMYSDGSQLQNKQALNAGSKETLRVRIEYKKDITSSDLPSEDKDLVFTFTIHYVQKDSTAISIPRPESFGTDDWETIVGAIRSGNTSAYHVGDTKEIDLGDYGVHTVRIANMSTPSECNQANFSQTACGFVLEFANIITKMRHRDYYSSEGMQWNQSEIRTFLNNDLYNSFPPSLKEGIISTYVLFSASRDESPQNYVGNTTDYLYLLNSVEVLGVRKEYMPLNKTRQLDYYASIPVNSTSTSGAIKTSNGTPYYWWLRSAYQMTRPSGLVIETDGSIDLESGNRIDLAYGVSPAFRIG